MIWFGNKGKIVLLLALFTGSGGVTLHAADNPLAYRPLLKSQAVDWVGEQQNLLVQGLLWPLSFYATVLSRVDGDRCPSQPSCSLYARQAIDQYGGGLGLWMMVDRLIHERTAMRHAVQYGRIVRQPDGGIRVLDTLEENDFWLRGER